MREVWTDAVLKMRQENSRQAGVLRRVPIRHAGLSGKARNSDPPTPTRASHCRKKSTRPARTNRRRTVGQSANHHAMAVGRDRDLVPIIDHNRWYADPHIGAKFCPTRLRQKRHRQKLHNLRFWNSAVNCFT